MRGRKNTSNGCNTGASYNYTHEKNRRKMKQEKREEIRCKYSFVKKKLV
jgi:hypothetical protein